MGSVGIRIRCVNGFGMFICSCLCGDVDVVDRFVLVLFMLVSSCMICL